MTTARYPVTPLNQVRRQPHRGHYDAATVFDIVDRCPIAHVGFLAEGRPLVIPMTCARQGDTLLLHGARKSRFMEAVDGAPVCLTLTLLDAVVYARSIFHSSMNYRSAVIHGRARPIEDAAEKLAALEVMSEHLMPGRWAEVRAPLAKELKATEVMRVTIESASAKVRDIGVLDEERDYTPEQWASTWAGVLPLQTRFGMPLTEADVAAGIPVPASVAARACQAGDARLPACADVAVAV